MSDIIPVWAKSVPKLSDNIGELLGVGFHFTVRFGPVDPNAILTDSTLGAFDSESTNCDWRSCQVRQACDCCHTCSFAVC